MTTTALTNAFYASDRQSTRLPVSPAHHTAASPVSTTFETAPRHARPSATIKADNLVVIQSSSPSPQGAHAEGHTSNPEEKVMGETVIEHRPSDLLKLTETFSPEQQGHVVTTPKPQKMNRPMITPKPSTPREPRSAHRTRSKVTKVHPPTQSRTATAHRPDLDDLVSKNTVTQEDLLHVLLTRYNREKQEREQIRANHATEIHELEMISRSLWERLQESQQKEKSHENELSGLRAQQPKFATQIKKLRDYVKGLTNDQHGLRDSLNEMERMYTARRESKQQLDADLQDVRRTASDIDKRTASALKDARHEIENLMRSNQDQKAQLRKDDELLQYERTRSQRLENEIAKINTCQQQSMHTFAEHANQVVQKMNSVLSHTQEAQSLQCPEALDEIKAALRQCLGSLDELQQAKNIKTEDHSQSEGSMKAFADEYVPSCFTSFIS